MPPCWAGRSLAFNGTFPRSNPTVTASTGSTLGGAWRWEAPPDAGPATDGAAGLPEEQRKLEMAHIRMYPCAGPQGMFFILYTPPPGIELTLPGGGSGALPLGQRGGGLVVGDILYAPFKHDDIGRLSTYTKWIFDTRDDTLNNIPSKQTQGTPTAYHI